MKKILLRGCVLTRQTLEEGLVGVWNRYVHQEVKVIVLSAKKRNCTEPLAQCVSWCRGSAVLAAYVVME